VTLPRMGTTQLQFHEQMTGYFAIGSNDPRAGEVAGRAANTWFGFELTIEIDDLDKFLADPKHTARVEGHYLGNLFGADTPVKQGVFNFMSPGSGRERLMEHHHVFEYAGRTYRFDGIKHIDDDPLAWDNVSDLTTLYSTVRDDQGDIVAAGVLHFPMKDFAKLVASFTTHGTGDELTAKMKFLKLFLKEEIYEIAAGFSNPPPPANRRRALARSHDELNAKYDVVVIGSGYGGGAAALRLASWQRNGAKKSVCVLERGREWRAGDFPEEPWDLASKLRAPWDANGLFEFHMGSDIDVVTGNGLGGTSLINANVMIQPEASVFREKGWPATLPNLAPYYARAREVIAPNPHPTPPLKSIQFRKAAAKESKPSEVALTDIAVTFDASIDRHDTGNTQTGCTGCGNCVTGCNYTAKNTVDMTYLSAAEKFGAEIFAGIEVRTIAKTATGFVLDLYDHEIGAGRTLEAKQVVVAAGVLGSYAILERSKKAGGIVVSSALGSKFNGNGDVLGFGYNGDEQCDPDNGPTITTIAKYTPGSDPRHHFIIEDGGIPRALTFLVRQALPWIGSHGIDTSPGVLSWIREWVRARLDQVGLPNHGALSHSLVYLGMGSEETTGNLALDGDSVRVKWPGVSNLPFAKAIDAKMLEVTKGISGTYVLNPEPRSMLMNKLITVHPLGGCPMGENANEGVVNAKGEVFGYEGGLYVADGAIVPTALGVNPALTIAALSEMIAEGITRGWTAAASG
jgi:cholesterol oxidase